tara:strand:+ start:40 stop:342 length:303 start_codon:yes stop_codon:yes gene_type:complete
MDKEEGFRTQTSRSANDGEKFIEDIVNTGGSVVGTGLETGEEIVTTGLQTGEELVGDAVDGTQEILSAGVNLARTTTQDTGKFMLLIGVGLMIPFIMSKI